MNFLLSSDKDIHLLIENLENPNIPLKTKLLFERSLKLFLTSDESKN